MMPYVFLLFALLGLAAAAGPVDTNCTAPDGADVKYTEFAVKCDNVLPDDVCLLLYTKAVEEGKTDERNEKCFQDAAKQRSEKVVSAALSTCPKTCGYCCLTADYNCKNKDTPRINCEAVTNAQCKDESWQKILAEDCPARCGLCNKKASGCADKIENCGVDPSICQNVNLQAFVKENCQKTCGFCEETGQGTGTAAPSTECVDTKNCASWVANGFCNSRFYDEATKRRYCGKSCNLC